MNEAARLRASREAIAVDCPWCSQLAGESCMTVDGKAMTYPHEQRVAAHYLATRKSSTSH